MRFGSIKNPELRAKSELSAKIAGDLEAFLGQGGEITVLPSYARRFGEESNYRTPEGDLVARRGGAKRRGQRAAGIGK